MKLIRIRGYNFLTPSENYIIINFMIKSMKESEIKQLVDKGWIRFKMVTEIAGTPETHINKTMKEVVDRLEKEEVKIISSKRHPAKDMGENIFSAFTETELLISKVSKLFGIMYDYMPSSVEIIEPDELTETTANIGNVINDLIAKLHQYNNAFNRLTASNIVLQNEVATGSANKDKKE